MKIQNDCSDQRTRCCTRRRRRRRRSSSLSSSSFSSWSPSPASSSLSFVIDGAGNDFRNHHSFRKILARGDFTAAYIGRHGISGRTFRRFQRPSPFVRTTHRNSGRSSPRPSKPPHQLSQLSLSWLSCIVVAFVHVYVSPIWERPPPQLCMQAQSASAAA